MDSRCGKSRSAICGGFWLVTWWLDGTVRRADQVAFKVVAFKKLGWSWNAVWNGKSRQKPSRNHQDCIFTIAKRKKNRTQGSGNSLNTYPSSSSTYLYYPKCLSMCDSGLELSGKVGELGIRASAPRPELILLQENYTEADDRMKNPRLQKKLKTWTFQIDWLFFLNS